MGIAQVGFKTSDTVLSSLSTRLGFQFPEIDPFELGLLREFAFDSTSAAEFAWFYNASEVFSKFSNGDQRAGAMRVLAAKSKFYEAEGICRTANERLYEGFSRASLNQTVLRRARGLVSRVLGPFPWESFPWACGFGPGASLGLRRVASSQQNKWVMSTHITQAAIPYFAAFRRWAGVSLPIPDRLTVADGNRVTTVPKNYKTDRVIAIEPDWNAFLQKGVGQLIRRRLQKFAGLLLPDAQETNRDLARWGSIHGRLATLDMSMASDTVSLSLCELLLPEDWMRVLMDLRSPKGIFGDDPKPVVYEKMSSMGNGFTFELETLLFWALTLGTTGKDSGEFVRAYGDDIICPSKYAPNVIETLRETGFSVNTEKSFYDSPFRESCGGHYWRGEDVTPFYVRRPLSHIGDLIVLGNHLKVRTQRWPRWNLRLEPVRQLIKKHVPRILRGPWGMDGCLWSEWDECHPTWWYDFQCYRQSVCVKQARYKDFSTSDGGFLHKLWNVSEDLLGSVYGSSTDTWVLRNRFVDRDAWSARCD